MAASSASSVNTASSSMAVSSTLSVINRALIKASKHGDLNHIRELMVDSENRQGIDEKTITRAMFFAAYEGHTSVCEYLMDSFKFNVNSLYQGRNLLLISLSKGHVDTSCFFVENGVDPHLKDPSGLSALHYAAKQGDLNLLEVLISKGVNVYAESPIGTPLIVAMENNHSGAAKMLLEYRSTAYFCCHCNYVKKFSENEFKDHYRVEHRNYKLPCKSCKNKFRKTADLISHETKSHAAPSPAQIIQWCVHCDQRNFTSPDAIDDHNDQVHRNYKVPCPDCRNKFLDFDALDSHISNHS